MKLNETTQPSFPLYWNKRENCTVTTIIKLTLATLVLRIMQSSCSRNLVPEFPATANAPTSPLRNSLENGLNDAHLLTLGSPNKDFVDSPVQSRPVKETTFVAAVSKRVPQESDKENFAQPRIPTPKRKAAVAKPAQESTGRGIRLLLELDKGEP